MMKKVTKKPVPKKQPVRQAPKPKPVKKPAAKRTRPTENERRAAAAERRFKAAQKPLFKESAIKGSSAAKPLAKPARAATQPPPAASANLPATIAAKNGKTPAQAVPKRAAPPVLALEAKALQIVDSASQAKAVDMIGRLKLLINKINTDYKPQIDAAKETVEAIKNSRDEKIAPLAVAENLLRERDRAYYLKQKENEEKAEQARLKKLRELEIKERRERAGQLMADGKDEEAKRLLGAPSDVEERPPAKPATPTGSSSRDTPWKWRLKNPDSLAGIPLDFLMIDTVKLNAFVRKEGEKAEEVITAIKVYKDVSLAYNTAREVEDGHVEVHPPAEG